MRAPAPARGCGGGGEGKVRIGKLSCLPARRHGFGFGSACEAAGGAICNRCFLMASDFRDCRQ